MSLTWEGPPDDPNEAIFQSLTESEQVAYDLALNGPHEYRFPSGIIDLSPTEMLEAWENQGCAGQARAAVEVRDPTQLLNSPEFQPLSNAIREFETSLFDNSNVLFAEIEAEWSRCMTDAGYPGFSTQIEPQNYIVEQSFSIVPRPGTENPNLAELEALREREIELAVADLNCRQEVNYWDRINAIRESESLRFIEDHKLDFEAIRDAMEQRGLKTDSTS